MSSVEGPLNPPLSNSTLSEYFSREIFEKQGTRPALICRNEPPRAHGGPLSRNLGVKTHLAWDFEEFDRHIKAVARGLLTMGVKKGDRVGVLMGNNRYCTWFFCTSSSLTMACSAYASLQWACASIGMTRYNNIVSQAS
jgi:acyl-CoA synthetase (AMP-forming)/AMP-acid ligase II